MHVEIWSDVVCPWCYIGKRRFEKALAAFDHRDDVEVVYRSFELDPSTPKGGTQKVADYLSDKYGGSGHEMVARVTEVAREEGIEFDHANSPRSNTIDAHRLLHLALESGGPALQSRVKERFLKAYFAEAQAVDDPEVLARLAVEAGLPADRVADVLASDEYRSAVDHDAAEARALGANGVPFFVIDRKYGISGAQPTELFGQALTQAWSESHPVLTTLGGADGDAEVCGPDGCAV